MPMAQRDFTRHRAAWWREVKADCWGEVKPETLKLVKLLLEASRKEALVGYTQAQWHARTTPRLHQRKGFDTRALRTALGCVTDLRVPRSRDGRFRSAVLPRSQRRQPAVNDLVRDVVLAGVSTRRVGEVVQPLLGVPGSAPTVSTVTKTRDAAGTPFQRRPLLDEDQVLLLDGVRQGVKTALGATKRVVLVASGVTVFGRRERLAFRQAASEAHAAWEAFLTDRYHRGSEGANLKLVVTDGCTGLPAAREGVYPSAKRQRGGVHQLRHVATTLPRTLQAACRLQATTLDHAPTRREAVTRFRHWERRWQRLAPQAVTCLRVDPQERLTFLDFPAAQRVKLRTTHVIERGFREVRRRTRPIGGFTTAASCDRITDAVFPRLTTIWQDRPLRAVTQFT